MKSTHNLRLMCGDLLDLCRYKPAKPGYGIYAINFHSKVSCCLHMHFLWWHHLPPGKSENGQDSDSDWFTYCIDIYDCWHCFLVFNIWVSHYPGLLAFEMTIHILPTLELFCFLFTQPFTHSKFCLPNPFLFDATPEKEWPVLKMIDQFSVL
jgi:hypothetical protein